MGKYWGVIIFLLSNVIFAKGSTMFFHDPSYITITPKDVTNSDFGFSLAYQDNNDGNLLVGAPHGANELGDVYVCPMHSIMKNMSLCTPMYTNLKTLAPKTEYNYLHPKQTFCLGASIVATPDYFLSCAPLWSREVPTLRLQGDRVNFRSAVGICFIYKNTTRPSRVNAMVEQYVDSPSVNQTQIELMHGSTGWNAYYDRIHEEILLGKYSDIIYLNAKSIQEKAKSWKQDYNQHKGFWPDGKLYLGQSITSGTFLADSKDIYYAVGMRNTKSLGGKIIFLTKSGNKTNSFMKNVENMSISGPETAMYGSALLSCDVNQDGVDDLIVGAPAYTRDRDLENSETGAVYIHLGGKDIGSMSNQLSIHGSMDRSRFGATLAHSDVDGDGLPELIVSAPYEMFNGSTGAVYVISGSEIRNIIKKKQNNPVTSIYELNLNDLKHVQKIMVQGMYKFGYSLQVIKDADSNGCDELAVGAPESAAVILLRCLPRINVTQISFTNTTVDDQDIVEVCIHVSYPAKPEKITTKLTVVCSITQDGAEFVGSNVLVVYLSSRLPQYCNKLTIKYNYHESLSHHFTAKLDIEEHEKEFAQKEFNSGWVTLSQYSKTEAMFEIMKPCLDASKICIAKFDAYFLWKYDVEPVKEVEYSIGQSETENITLKVISKGIPSFGCVQLMMNVPASVPCVRDDEGYHCNLKPIERNETQNIRMVLKMNEFTDKDTLVTIKAKWYPVCQDKNNFDTTQLDINLKITPQVYINGSSHNLNITESELSNQKSLDNMKNEIKDNHEYTIINNNSLHWVKVGAEIKVYSPPFATHKMTKTQYSVCDSKTSTVSNETIFNCTLDLKPRSTAKLIICTDILKTKIRENLKNNTAIIASNISLKLASTDVEVTGYQYTTILLQKDTYVRNNKLMIILLAIFIAIVIIGLIVYGLYRCGFFERKKKKQLVTMRESIKRKNSEDAQNLDNSSGDDEDKKDNSSGEAIDEVFDVEVVDLNDRDMDTNVLIETEVDVHNKDDSNGCKGPRQDTAPSSKTKDIVM